MSKLHRAALSGCHREARDGFSRFLSCGTFATIQRGGTSARASTGVTRRPGSVCLNNRTIMPNDLVIRAMTRAEVDELVSLGRP